LSASFVAFDVHINRAPIAGTITDVAYTHGKFLIATSAKASLLNEQNSLTIKGEKIRSRCSKSLELSRGELFVGKAW
jgi:phosphatidylserine decarboxylase